MIAPMAEVDATRNVSQDTYDPEVISQSTEIVSLKSMGDAELAATNRDTVCYEPIVAKPSNDQFSLSSELDDLKQIVEVTKKRNRKSLAEELKCLWEGISNLGKDMEFESQVLSNSESSCNEDNDSVYESETSPVETVYRAQSYEFIPMEKMPYDLQGGTDYLVNEKNKGEQVKQENDRKDSKGENNTETFVLNKENPFEDVVDSSLRNEPSLSEKSASFSDHEASLDVSFSNILADDIIADSDTKNLKDVVEEDAQIIQMIVDQLKSELKPILEQLTKESEKYQILKRLYKLPSVSNLDKQVQNKFKRGSKNFNLSFDENIIKQLILEKRMELNKQLREVHSMSAHDQMKLNFNKYRQLDTISEDIEAEKTNTNVTVISRQKLEKLEDEEEKPSSKIEDFICNKIRYSRLRDNRHISDISTGELSMFLKSLKENKMSDIGTVNRIVGFFEKEYKYENRSISKIPNSTLQREIQKELIKRSCSYS